MKKKKLNNKQINFKKYLLICSLILFLLGIVNLFLKNKSLGFANITLGLIFLILCGSIDKEDKK